MPGLWEWIDSVASALLNFRRPNLGSQGPSILEPKGQFILGASRPFGREAPEEGELVTVPLASFSKHFAMFGSSGCGKSTATHRVRDKFIEEGINCIDIDYRGDGFDRAVLRLVAQGIPPERVTLIDLRDRERVVPLNFLGYGAGDAQSKASVVYQALI